MTTVLLSLGSNLGDRLETLRSAIERLRASRIKVFRCSSVYETEPVDIPDQPEFLNMVAVARTPLHPEGVLAVCQEVEASLGRIRPGAARTIDIDLLYYGILELVSKDLQVPHPRLYQRRFVLVPLLEVAPELVDPVRNQTIQAILEQCPDQSRVTLFSTGNQGPC